MIRPDDAPSQVFLFEPAKVPLLISLPHAGTYVTPDIARDMTPTALGVPDTDWYVDRLHEFGRDLGTGFLTATHSRYVIDLNRAPDNRPLYPGASNTELCPTMTLAKSPIYQKGRAPDAAEIARRRALYWEPYHQHFGDPLQAMRLRHGTTLLYEAHTIRARVPRFLHGSLPDLNLSTGGGETADLTLERRLFAICDAADAHTSELKWHFQGSHITRYYDRPAKGMHAVQLELAQQTYMTEDPLVVYRPSAAAKERPVPCALLRTMIEWATAR